MKETLIDSNDFRWSTTDLSNSYASSGYSGWIVRTDSIGDPQNTGEGSYEPMAIKVEGPEPLLATISQVEIFGHSLKVVANPDDGDYYVASEMDPSRPATLTVVNSPRVDLAELQLPDYTEPVPGFVEEPGDGAKLSDMKHMMDFFDRDMDNVVTAADFQNFLLQRALASAKIVSSLDFYKGILVGLYGNPADSVADLCGLAKGAVKVATLTNPLRTFYEFTFGDRYEGEIAASKRAWDTTVGWATEVASFIAAYYAQGEAALIAAITQGIALPGTEKMSMFAKVAIDTIFMLLIAGEEAWDKLSNYNKGYGVGYVCAEIIISGVAALITAEVGGAGALVTLGRHSPKLLKIFHLIRPAITKLKLALAEFGDVAALLNKFIDKLTLAKVQKWCFIAGTPVMTMAGPVPIEQIHPGMMVWCAPESGQGTGCFSPVLETYQNRAPEVWRIAYDHDRNATTPDATLTASAGHPVWVEERHEFVSAKDLQPGEHLRLAAGGGTVPVSSLTRQSAPPGGIRVFNLAVAEHHTYFAGNGGVWVHNLCSDILKQYWAKFETIYDNSIKKGLIPPDAWDDALRQVMGAVQSDLITNKRHTYDNLADAAAKIFSESGGKIPDAVLAARWKDLVYEFAKVRRDTPPELRRQGGNAFDHLRAAYYRSKGGFSQVTLGNGKKLDSYIPGKEIVSRKWKQYSNNGREDFANDLDEMITKYATPTPQRMKSGGIANDTVKDSETAELIKRTIDEEIAGTPILEIPIQDTPIPAEWLHEARVRGVMVRDVAGNIIQIVSQ